MRSKFCSSGGCGASVPANSAMTTIRRARTTPVTTTPLPRVRRSGRLHRIWSRARGTVLTPSAMTSAARLAASRLACQSFGRHRGPRFRAAPRPTPCSRHRRVHMDCCSHEGPDRGDARFDFQTVADGVHVAVAAPAYKVNCNTAIIESDDGVIIVDTHSKPSAARVLVARIRELTPKPVRYVINTHFHWDHWHGNEVYPQAYPGAEIVTNQITREAMVKKGVKRIQDHVRQVPAEIAKLKADLAGAKTPAERATLERNLRLAESYLAEVSALRPALPTVVFEQTMKLYQRDREIHLLHLGRAHTEGDVFVYLPKEKVVITGDALIGWTPYLGDGYPEERVTTLDRHAQLDFTHIIMGHGDPAGRD